MSADARAFGGARLAEKRATWERLTALLDRIDRQGLGSLPREELRELGRLHRRTTSHLAQARSGRRDKALIAYLNDLVLRSHNTVYRTPGRPVGRAVLRFILSGFPAACQRSSRFIVASVLLSMIFATIAFVATYRDPRLAGAFVPQAILQQVDIRNFGDHTGLDEAGEWAKPIFSSGIMWHNMQVSVICFALGVAFGVPTVAVLIQNAFMLGGLAGLCHEAGVHVRFWAFILPHGVIELTAIFIAGGAGMQLGWALIAPGQYRRRDSLAVAGREAVLLALGVLPMLVVAGTIEGFVSPAHLPDRTKLTFAAVMGLLTLVYLCRPVPREELEAPPGAEAAAAPS